MDNLQLKKFAPDQYDLAVPFSLVGKSELIQQLMNTTLQDEGVSKRGISNRDANKMTIVAVTGVTALVRGTAYFMENMA